MPTTETLNQSPTIGAIDDADLLWVWDTSASALNKVARSNLVGATITGGGTIATNGATFTIPSGGGQAAILNTGPTDWTPSWTFGTSGSVTYTTRVGRYLTINGIAFVWGYIVVNALSSPVGGAFITLPVNSVTLTNYIAAVSITTAFNWATNMTLRAYVSGTSSNESRLQFHTQATNAAAVALAGTDFAAGCTLGFTVIYQVP